MVRSASKARWIVPQYSSSSARSAADRRPATARLSRRRRMDRSWKLGRRTAAPESEATNERRDACMANPGCGGCSSRWCPCSSFASSQGPRGLPRRHEGHEERQPPRSSTGGGEGRPGINLDHAIHPGSGAVAHGVQRAAQPQGGRAHRMALHAWRQFRTPHRNVLRTGSHHGVWRRGGRAYPGPPWRGNLCTGNAGIPG